MPEETGRPHLQSIALALLLVVLEQSDILAQLSITLYDQLVKGRPPAPEWVYEISMVWLAVGTCIVIVVASLAQDRNRADDWTIAVGVITATVLGLFSVVDAWLNDEDLKGKTVLLQVLFFFGIWLLLVLFPLLRALLKGEALLGSGVVATALCLVVAIVISIPYRWVTAELLWKLVQAGNANSANAAFDRLIYNADTLLILGATWAMAAFSAGRSFAWKLSYAVACGFAAAAYPLLFNDASDWPASYALVILGFVLLSLAALMPMWWSTARIWSGDRIALGASAALCFLACGVAMFATLGQVWNAPPLEFWSLVLVQAGAGSLIPASVFAAGRLAAAAQGRQVV